MVFLRHWSERNYNSGTSGRRLAGRGRSLKKRTKCLVASTAIGPHVTPKQGGWQPCSLCHSSDTLSGMAREDPHWLVPVWCCTGTRKVLAHSRKGRSRPAGLWEQPRALLASLTKKPPCPHPPSPSFSEHPCVGSLPAHTLWPTPLVCGRW